MMPDMTPRSIRKATWYQYITRGKEFPRTTQTSQPTLGIDIGTSAIKAVALHSDQSQVTIQGYGLATLPPASGTSGVEPAVLAAGIRQAAHRAAPSCHSAAVAIGADAVLIREIPLPTGLSESATAARVALFIDEQMQQSPAELRYDWRYCPQSAHAPDQTLLQLTAARRETIEAACDHLKAANLDCPLVDVEPHAAARVTRLAYPHASGITAIVDVGVRLHLSILDGQRIVYSRSERLAEGESHSDMADAITQAIAIYQEGQQADAPSVIELLGGRASTRLAEAVTLQAGVPTRCLATALPVDWVATPATEDIADCLPRLLIALGLAMHAGASDAHWR